MIKFTTKHVFFLSLVYETLAWEPETNKQWDHHPKTARIYFVRCSFYLAKSPVKWELKLVKNVWLGQCTLTWKQSNSFNCQSASLIFLLSLCLSSFTHPQTPPFSALSIHSSVNHHISTLKPLCLFHTLCHSFLVFPVHIKTFIHLSLEPKNTVSLGWSPSISPTSFIHPFFPHQ